jgi:lipopolysaccharide/colanic/teichoic acid biosynthesis glycosyltransferase
MTRTLYFIFLVMITILIVPLGVFLCLIIALTSGFPVLFVQKRIGKGGKTFTLFKFRTMHVGADALQGSYRRYLNEADGPVFKIRNDPRFTRIGKFLSHTGLDELPQIVNIWKGEMAIIGPRPLPVAEAAKLKSQQRERHLVKPGILSPWVLDGYHTKPFSEWMKSDVAYAKRKNVREDMSLLLRALILLPPKIVWTTVIYPVLSSL